jgi:DNA polymerase-3 subunit epsilon
MLKLKKPIVFFDLEATGLDVYNDRIVQIGIIKFNTDETKEEYKWLINPKVPISKEATEVHGITDEMVQDKPTFGDIAQELIKIFHNSDLGGYNVKNYDIPMLQNEFSRIGLQFDLENVSIVDAMAIYMRKESRKLQDAYKKYVGKELENAHDAMADIQASIEVLEGQIKFYDDLPSTVEELSEYCFPADPNAYDTEGKLVYKDGELAINFGKNKGRTLKELSTNDQGYLRWILNGSFPEKVKDAVRAVLR